MRETHNVAPTCGVDPIEEIDVTCGPEMIVLA